MDFTSHSVSFTATRHLRDGKCHAAKSSIFFPTLNYLIANSVKIAHSVGKITKRLQWRAFIQQHTALNILTQVFIQVNHLFFQLVKRTCHQFCRFFCTRNLGLIRPLAKSYGKIVDCSVFSHNFWASGLIHHKFWVWKNLQDWWLDCYSNWKKWGG